jgi:hypothetical protein
MVQVFWFTHASCEKPDSTFSQHALAQNRWMSGGAPAVSNCRL